MKYRMGSSRCCCDGCDSEDFFDGFDSAISGYLLLLGTIDSSKLKPPPFSLVRADRCVTSSAWPIGEYIEVQSNFKVSRSDVPSSVHASVALMNGITGTVENEIRYRPHGLSSGGLAELLVVYNGAVVFLEDLALQLDLLLRVRATKLAANSFMFDGWLDGVLKFSHTAAWPGAEVSIRYFTENNSFEDEGDDPGILDLTMTKSF